MGFICPMHPEVVSKNMGKCPKCGMDLIEAGKEDQVGMHDHHGGHGHSSMMAGPGAAQNFLRRFFIVTALLVPLALFSRVGVEFLGVPDFTSRPFLEFVIATLIFYFGLVFFEHAGHEIKARAYGMMTLVSMAVGAGYLFSVISTFIPAIGAEFYLEISTLIWVLLFGHFLEAKSSTAAGDALQEVAKLLPKQAHLLVGGKVKDVSVDSLKKGDVVKVLPGEKVPADGKLIDGLANFNEAHISGESRPVEKSRGDMVIAGAICIDGSVEVELTRVGENSTIGQIEKLIADAKNTKPTAQKIADRASKWLTFAALGVAVLTLGVWSLVVGETFVFAMTLAITVLVIACPHALGLAIPTVSTIATRLAVKNGVFIKDMAKLEVAKSVDYVIFDKTGTLTKGNFAVIKVIPETKRSKAADGKLLGVAASLEEHSKHPVAAGILEEVRRRKIKFLKARKIKSLAGKGISGVVGGSRVLVGNSRLVKVPSGKEVDGTVVYVEKDREYMGAIVLGDVVRPESKVAVERLHSLGVKVAMMTGDGEEVAKKVAKSIGIDTVFSQVLPENKYAHVKNLQNKGNKVMMIGDGVNDAPALTQSNVGVAVGAGTEVAVEAGDIVLTRNNPEDIAGLVVLARGVYRKMQQNLVWALGYNVLAIPAAAGLFIPWGVRLSPEFGALLMSLSSVIVVINAMTLRKLNLKR